MSTESSEKHVGLAPEDLARVRRLTEEVKGRLYEVGLIMGRTLNLDVAPGTAIKYEPKQSAEQGERTIEIVIIALPDGTFACCQDPPGVCIYPC